LRSCAGGCRIARYHSKNAAIFGLRFVPALAATCRSLVHRKGKKRAILAMDTSTSARAAVQDLQGVSDLHPVLRLLRTDFCTADDIVDELQFGHSGR